MRDHPDDQRPVEQASLFGAAAPAREPPLSPLAELPAVTGRTTLAATALAYRAHLLLSACTPHTVDCFLSDLRLLTRHLGGETAVADLARHDLVDWLHHLRWESATTPAPKTLARRITFLKNYCAWLAGISALPEDIAAHIAVTRPLPPLPDLLFEPDLAQLLEAARGDSRAHLLIVLALEAGLKKEEILALTPERVDCSDPARPLIYVRLPGTGRTQRERTLLMPPEFVAIIDHYQHDYQPQGPLFDCTERTLTNVLGRTAARARLGKRVTLQGLRDAYAVRLLRGGLSLELLREKLGLAEETWSEAREKYRKLAFPA